MRRRLLNLLTFVSVPVLMSVAVLWVRDVGYSVEVDDEIHDVGRVYGPHLGVWLEWGPSDGARYRWSLPYWKAALLSSALPVLWAWKRYSLRLQLRRGLCRSCGYDLRATPDRCPECGEACAAQ